MLTPSTPTAKTPKPIFSIFFRGLGPGNPWKRSPGTIWTHTGPYGSIRIHPDTSQVNLKKIMLTWFDQFCIRLPKIRSGPKKQLFWWQSKLFPFQFCGWCTKYQILGTSFWWFRGHLKFDDLGLLGDPTSVLVGGAPSGDYFSQKSPIWKWETVDFHYFNEKW